MSLAVIKLLPLELNHPGLVSYFINQLWTKLIAFTLASAVALVTPIGGLTAGVLMDSIGRLNTIKLAVIPSVIGWTLIATAWNVPMIIAGRVLTGIANSKIGNNALTKIFIKLSSLG